MKKVLIPTKLDSAAGEILSAHGGYTVIQDDTRDASTLAREHPDAYALIVRSEKVTPAVMDLLPQLKVVVRAGAGYDNIDVHYARRKGVDVMNTPGANANAVAEEVIALILADSRHIVAADASVRAGRWEKNRFMGRELAEKTVGIVGLGSVGRMVARRLSGFDVRLLGCDPVLSADRAREMNVELTDMETLFGQSDYITLHTPENEETRGLIGEKLLALIRPGATLVNCARAGVVDEEAVRRVKKAKGLRFLNDVYASDSAGPKSVADIADILMPHLGASTLEANRKAARRAAEQLVDFDDKGVTSFIVNREIPEGLDESYCRLANTLARLGRCLLGRVTLKMVETTFYGDLHPYGDWLIVPIVAGIWEDFERARDCRGAVAFLKEMGIEYLDREVDEGKGYDNSITVDLTGSLDAGTLRRVSVRGTIAEGTLIVSRIDEFEKLYFEPAGDTLLVLYDDRPGVIGAIGQKLASAGVNIEDMRNSHESRANRSLAIMKVNRKPPDAVLEGLRAEPGTIAAVSIRF